jgi:hypothetical protein
VTPRLTSCVMISNVSVVKHGGTTGGGLVGVRVAVVGGATSLLPVCVVSVASCLVEPVVAASRIVKVNVCRRPRDQRGGNNDLSCEHGAFVSRLPADGVCGVGGWSEGGGA